MRFDDCWKFYLKNSKKLSWLLRGYFLILVLYVGLSLFLQLFIVSDILQYLYLTAFYEMKGSLSEHKQLKEVPSFTFWKILPASFVFYTKSILLICAIYYK